jgi:predicted Zn finger-like uncharacterized protein
MLIVCPSCATSYMIDPASVGPSGRAVRCARCKTTWFAGDPKSAPNINALVDGSIAEAGPPSAPDHAPAEADKFGGGSSETFPSNFGPDSAPPPLEDAKLNTDLVRHGDDAHEPVAISDAPSLVPPIEHEALRETASAETDLDEAETFAARRQRLKARRQKARRASRWTAIILVLFSFNLMLIGARNEVVRHLPQTASLFAAIGLPVNLRNLKFENVRISKETQDGVNILIVEGKIVSTASNPTEVPRLRFAARNATGQDVYTWTARPSRSMLGPGESMEFRSHLASPPADATDIMVRFFTAQDAVAGVK